jgi:hypothetical protein
VSYRPDWGIRKDTNSQQDENDFALYWMNDDGGREYLHGDPTLGIQRPVALGHKPSQPIIPDTVDYKKSTGTLYVHDVYQGVGLQGVPRGEAKKLRVVRLNYRAAGVGQTHNGGEGGGSINSSPVSIGNGSWDIKEIIGDADIHEDGSVSSRFRRTNHFTCRFLMPAAVSSRLLAHGTLCVPGKPRGVSVATIRAMRTTTHSNGNPPLLGTMGFKSYSPSMVQPAASALPKRFNRSLTKTASTATTEKPLELSI